MHRRPDSSNFSDTTSIRRLNLLTPSRTPGLDGDINRSNNIVAVTDE